MFVCLTVVAILNLDPFVTKKKAAIVFFKSAAKIFLKVTKLNIENGNNNMPTKQQQQKSINSASYH